MDGTPEANEPDEAVAPMRILWYWPHPHRGESELAAATTLPGDTLTVQCLASFRGEVLDPHDADHEKVRDLPDVSHATTRTARRVLNRVAVHATRAWRRRRLARSGRFDVLHIQNVSLLDGLSLRGLARTIPIVMVVHDVEPHRQVLPGPLQRLALSQALRQATALVVHHPSIKDLVVRTHGVDPAVVRVVPHPLLLRYEPNPFRSEGPLRVLLFGSLRPNKGIGHLLEAASRLSPDAVHLTIAGSGDGSIEQQVRDAAAAIPQVRAEIAYVSEERRLELFREADIVALPYTDQFLSQSGVLFDSYEVGVPLLVTDVGAIGATVRSDGSGWVVPTGDVDAMVAKIEELAAHPEERRRVAEHLPDALAPYRCDNVGRSLRRIYDDVVRDART